jgi:DNA-binding transcriptional ArsR family regulator
MLAASIAGNQTKANRIHRLRPQCLFGNSVSRAAMNLDKLIHHPSRLGILSALARADSLSFKELMALLGETYGNFGAHARKLENANYVDCLKSFEARVPITRYRLTSEGRDALAIYLESMESIIWTMRRDSIGHAR